jgi:hypothetical protein
MFKQIPIAALAAGLALGGVFPAGGCALSPLPRDFALAGKEGMGVVYLSLTRVGSLESSIWLRLRGVGHGYSGLVAVDDYGVKRDWAKIAMSSRINDFGRASAEDPVGHLAAFALPAGEYEFFGWHGTSPMWSLPGDDYAIRSQDFSVRFTVRAGTLTYAGNLEITVPERIIPDHRQGTFQITVNDRQERDSAVLREKYPKLAGQAMAATVMNTASAGQALTFWVWPSTGPTRNGGTGDFSN